jgi:hypothetical protein
LWLWSVTDYWDEQQAQIRFQRSLVFSVGDIERPSLASPALEAQALERETIGGQASSTV